MSDFQELQGYREGNRLEFKEAKGQLPRSFWEAYSSLANTEAVRSSGPFPTNQSAAGRSTGR